VQGTREGCPFIIFVDNGGLALVCTSASYRLQSVLGRVPLLLVIPQIDDLLISNELSF